MDFSNLNHKPINQGTQISLPWQTLFSFLLWNTWLRRNERVFNLNQKPPDICILGSRALALEFFSSRNYSKGNNQSTASYIGWSPPTHGWWKLNTNASFVKNGEWAGLAGTFKDNQGIWKLGFDIKYRFQSILMGELKAIQRGMQIIEEKGWSNVFVCSDSKQAINAILDFSDVKDENYLIITQCRDLMKRVGGLRLEFELRNGNKVADRCARYCRTADFVANYLFLWDVPSDYLVGVIWEDKPP